MTLRDLYDECGYGKVWRINVETGTRWALRDMGDGVFVLAFPATWGKSGWPSNFDFLAIPYKHMPRRWRAHRGWVAKWKSIRDAVGAAIQAAAPRKLVITGFSQGGALAALAFEDVQFNKGVVLAGMEVVGVAFGSPRVVSWFAPSERWAGFKRIEVYGDIFCNLPPLLFGYKHVGEAIKVGPWRLIDPQKHGAYRDYFDGVWDAV